ncbi:MAG: hypothetical protein HUK40_16565 [Desulfobacter sp.]|nr:hypothetical protein [Desulfobacter sp.]
MNEHHQPLGGGSNIFPEQPLKNIHGKNVYIRNYLPKNSGMPKKAGPNKIEAGGGQKSCLSGQAVPTPKAPAGMPI